MTFYLKPPKGLTNIKNLEETSRQRLKCYENLLTENIEDVILESEYLVEDSIFDRLGHYLFRLTSLKSHNFLNIFITNEVLLLDVRLGCYNRDDLKYFIKKLKKHSMDCLETVKVDGQAKELFTLFIRVCIQMLRRGFFEHGFKEHKECCDTCYQSAIIVPFQLCPDLLATREYKLNSGFLHIYPFQWKDLILSLYKTYLLHAIKEMRNMQKIHDALEDERIKSVIIFIKTSFFKNNPYLSEGNRGTFRLENFTQESQKFPLCMQNLYGILQKKNRLGHNARFDFSLYLKGIGLSMGDALTFWANVYSKEHASCSRCTHSWQENEKRYVYGIRHLYGLEGSRKNYGVKSCYQIQDMTLAANEEGGCPFQHFDDDNLRKILQGCLPPSNHDRVEVIIYKRKESAQKACELFSMEHLNAVFEKKVTDEQIVFQNPAQYYLLTKSIAS